jgi:hypothetical protein
MAPAIILAAAIMLTSCGKYSKGDKLVLDAVDLYDEGSYESALDELLQVQDEELKSVKSEVYSSISGNHILRRATMKWLSKPTAKRLMQIPSCSKATLQ